MATLGQYKRGELNACINLAIKALQAINKDLEDILQRGDEEELIEFADTLQVYLEKFANNAIKSIKVLGILYSTVLYYTDVYDYIYRLQDSDNPKIAAKAKQTASVFKAMPEEIRVELFAVAKRLRKKLKLAIDSIEILQS